MKNKVKNLLESILKESVENKPKIKLVPLWPDRKLDRNIKFEKMLQKEVIEGNVEFTQLPNDLNVKTKVIKGSVSLLVDFIPLWFKDIVILGSFYIVGKALTSMEGCPKIIHGDFLASFNYFTDLTGSPEYVGGDYDIRIQTGEFTEEEVREVCKVDGAILVGDDL